MEVVVEDSENGGGRKQMGRGTINFLYPKHSLFVLGRYADMTIKVVKKLTHLENTNRFSLIINSEEIDEVAKEGKEKR